MKLTNQKLCKCFWSNSDTHWENACFQFQKICLYFFGLRLCKWLLCCRNPAKQDRPIAHNRLSPPTLVSGVHRRVSLLFEHTCLTLLKIKLQCVTNKIAYNSEKYCFWVFWMEWTDARPYSGTHSKAKSLLEKSLQDREYQQLRRKETSAHAILKIWYLKSTGQSTAKKAMRKSKIKVNDMYAAYFIGCRILFRYLGKHVFWLNQTSFTILSDWHDGCFGKRNNARVSSRFFQMEWWMVVRPKAKPIRRLPLAYLVCKARGSQAPIQKDNAGGCEQHVRMVRNIGQTLKANV